MTEKLQAAIDRLRDTVVSAVEEREKNPAVMAVVRMISDDLTVVIGSVATNLERIADALEAQNEPEIRELKESDVEAIARRLAAVEDRLAKTVGM